MRLSVYLLLLTINPVVDAQAESVTYTPDSLCALKGSTVFLSCTYGYTHGQRVTSAFWSKESVRGETKDTVKVIPPELSTDPNYRDRADYIGDKQNNCTLRLRNVTERDQNKYYYIFRTQSNKIYEGTTGVQLSVTGLKVEGPDSVTKGGSVTLDCKTNCTLTDHPIFNWYKNGQLLEHHTSQSVILLLNSFSESDSGDYSCSAQNHHSDPITFKIHYPPVRATVSSSPSGEVKEGSDVVLNCLCDSYPPAEFKWFRNANLISSGGIFPISNITSEQGGEYKCKCIYKNKTPIYGAVTLNVVYPPRKTSVLLNSSAAPGAPVNLTCICKANPPVQSYTWFREGGDSAVGSGEVYTAVQSGSYYCTAQNKYGTQTAPPLMVQIKGDNHLAVYVVIVLLLILIIIMVIVFIRWRRRISADQAVTNQENLRRTNQYEVEYAFVTHTAASERKTPEQPEEVEYSTIRQ